MLSILADSPALLLASAVLLGLLVGSFLNVVIHRLPLILQRQWSGQCRELLATEGGQTPHVEDEEPFSLSRPRSRCPACGHPISALENIPVLSYLFLRGRCRGCGTRIPARYPAVEALTALLSALAVWHFGASWAAVGALGFTWALVALTFIDLDHQLLPDDITLPLLWAGLLFNVGGVYTDLTSSVIGAVAGYLSLWLVYHGFRLLTGKEGMGYGDFKLLAVLGAWMGWQMLPAVILLSSIVGATVGIALILFRRHDRGVPIPFGPYLAAAGWIALIWGERLNQAYLDWVGLG